jgi:hypothetical protein
MIGSEDPVGGPVSSWPLAVAACAEGALARFPAFAAPTAVTALTTRTAASPAAVTTAGFTAAALAATFASRRQ